MHGLESISQPRYLSSTISYNNRKNCKATDVLDYHLALATKSAMSPRLEYAVNPELSRTSVRTSNRFIPRQSQKALHLAHHGSNSFFISMPELVTPKLKTSKRTSAPIQYRASTAPGKRGSKPIEIQEYMKPKWKQYLKNGYTTREIKNMKKIHLEHLQHDLETLSGFIQPSTRSKLPYENTMKRKNVIKARTAISSKRKSQGTRPHTSQTKNKNSNLSNDESTDIMVQSIVDNVKKDSRKKFKKMMKKYGDRKNEFFEMDKLRKNYEHRIQMKLVEKQRRKEFEEYFNQQVKQGYYFTPGTVTNSRPKYQQQIAEKFLPLYREKVDRRATTAFHSVAQTNAYRLQNQHTRQSSRF